MREGDIEARMAQLLRDLRRERGLTLQGFEELSGGLIKAVVLGSYERGTRAISLARLQQLADIYQVSVEYFLSPSGSTDFDSAERLIFDLKRVRELDGSDGEYLGLRRYLSSIVRKRRDWNGQVLSLRVSDAEILALIESCNFEELESRLTAKRLLIRASEKSNP